MPFDIPVAFFEAAMTLVHGHGGRIVDHSWVNVSEALLCKRLRTILFFHYVDKIFLYRGGCLGP